MKHFSPQIERPQTGFGVAGTLRPAFTSGGLRAADAIFCLTRTSEARAPSAAPSSLFERACRLFNAAACAWSDINANSHVERPAPPGRNPGGGGQRKSNPGVCFQIPR